MEKEVRNSLDGLTFDLSLRRSGKTRRIIDNAINILYEDGCVYVQDHNIIVNYPEGAEEVRSQPAEDRKVAEKIYNRLKEEDSVCLKNFSECYVSGILHYNRYGKQAKQ